MLRDFFKKFLTYLFDITLIVTEELLITLIVIEMERILSFVYIHIRKDIPCISKALHRNWRVLQSFGKLPNIRKVYFKKF